jgi:hypothetical protein
MDITIYRRHSADCDQKAERYSSRCGCHKKKHAQTNESVARARFVKVEPGGPDRCHVLLNETEAQKVDVRSEIRAVGILAIALRLNSASGHTVIT